MPNNAIWFGRTLILIGIVGYGWGLYVGAVSLTALIPAGVGIVLMVLGHLAAMREGLRKHLMHAAVIVGLLGFLAALGGLFRKGMPTSIGAGSLSQIAMAVVCLVFVILAVRSFMAARSERLG
ncbi:MAG TPA: hypothetical protein VGO43_16200 [Pyrinomonadaceae bacterium]|jgi:hypothetical protein|nr:hypothetical protein [Pyrinomonadaceae bacterium]